MVTNELFTIQSAYALLGTNDEHSAAGADTLANTIRRTVPAPG